MRLQAKVNALPVLCSSGRELQCLKGMLSQKGMMSASGEELSALSPSGRHAVPSALRPQGGAFKESCDPQYKRRMQ